MDAASLTEALSRLAPRLGGERVTQLRRLSGGASQETWAFWLEGAESRELILRRRPDGLGERDDRNVGLATEAALIRVTGARGAPVPPVLHVAAPEDGIGDAYVMGKVEGDTLGRRIVRDEAFALVRPGLARRCGEVLALIHRTPTTDLPSMTILSAEDELDRYETIYRTTGAERPIFELALRKLRKTAPKGGETVLLHGDFRNGNLMIHPQVGLAAVLDWELAHLGDAASDLGWLCVNSWRFGGDRPVGGFGDYQDLIDGYRAEGGAPVTVQDVRYWQMLGSLKWGIMCLTMYESFASGADASVERAMIGRRASETEIDLVNLMEGRA